MSKTEQNGTFDTFVVHLTNFFLSQIAFDMTYCFNARVNGSSILRTFSWFEQKMGIICQKTCLFVVQWISGALRPIPTKIAMIFSKLPSGYQDFPLLSHLNLFMQGSSSKIVRKTAFKCGENFKILSLCIS